MSLHNDDKLRRETITKLALEGYRESEIIEKMAREDIPEYLTKSGLNIAQLEIEMLCRRDNTFQAWWADQRKLIHCERYDCPCGRQPLKPGIMAYLWIPRRVQRFRSDYPTLIALERALNEVLPSQRREAEENDLLHPHFLCKIEADRLNLDLRIALQDGITVAQTGFAPLKETPERA